MQRQGSTRDAILDAAIEAFISKGFETTSMDAIAVEAGVAKGTLYYHFKSKEGIVEAIVDRYIVRVKETFAGIEADEGRGPIEKFTAFGKALKDINSESFAKLHHMKYIDIHEKTQKAMGEFLAPSYARIIEEGNALGLWKVAHALEVAEILIVAGSFLFDPENENKRSAARVAAFVESTARILGIGTEAIVPAFGEFARGAEPEDESPGSKEARNG
jgi:AcrR family transcriptional regulator